MILIVNLALEQEQWKIDFGIKCFSANTGADCGFSASVSHSKVVFSLLAVGLACMFWRDQVKNQN